MSIQDELRKGVANLQRPLQHVGRIPLLLAIIWLLAVNWGERSVFDRSVAACSWYDWEKWPANAQPHHVLLVADPQLVDPHTYPGRPWPLSTLTVLYTDLYLRRSYRQLVNQLRPHSTIFLGDLFDGGREWGTAANTPEAYVSPELQYQRYDDIFWNKEYKRFMKIFSRTWSDVSVADIPSSEGRRLIMSLPGNHDLGFANKINMQVRSRFEAHFGPLNRVDVLGNHTFVSVDTVSLSAKDQIDTERGGTGHNGREEIWQPTNDFLSNLSSLRADTIRQSLIGRGVNEAARLHTLDPPVVSAADMNGLRNTQDTSTSLVATAKYPTILLSHVPLYRPQEASCGPLREHNSPIPLSAGYQYQNVLTPWVSKTIVDAIDSTQLAQIYSGDDHDYCELDHNEFTGSPKEITVKSTSWAMGVKIPGVQLVSLYNPQDADQIINQDQPANTPRNTIQNKLCLLPNQLEIFLLYGKLLAITVLLLIIRAALYNPMQTLIPTPKDEPLLPLSAKHRTRPHSTSSVSAHPIGQFNVQARKTYSPPYVDQAVNDKQDETDDYGMPKHKAQRRPPQRVWLLRRSLTKGEELTKSLTRVAVPVLGYYFYLFWTR